LKKISENKKQCETLIKHRDFEKNAVKMRSNEKSAPFWEAAKRQKKNRKPFIQAVSGAPAKSRWDRIWTCGLCVPNIPVRMEERSIRK